MQHANPINITHIDHVVLRVTRLEEMIVFYRDVLGCKLERGPGDLGLAQLRAGHSLFDLVDADGPLGRQGGDLPDHKAPNMDHVCFQIEPWDAELIERHLHRFAIDTDPVGTRYGSAGMGPSLYLKDPEGNTIELKGKR
ncbi:MAG: VOC family protein [Gammaproteobacteria bacterium]|nr:VOC family protein [Gammaproteobacteria bacterium]